MIVETYRHRLIDMMVATYENTTSRDVESALVETLRRALDEWYVVPSTDDVVRGAALILDNAVYQLSEEDPDEAFVEDPIANLRAIVLFGMRAVGLLVAYNRTPEWLQGMTIADLEVLQFMCEDDPEDESILGQLRNAGQAAAAAAALITARRRQNPPDHDLDRIRAALVVKTETPE